MQETQLAEKTEAVIIGITRGVDGLCQCGFSRDTFHDIEVRSGFLCFEESSTAVTFRAEIMALPMANISQLLEYIEQWVATQPSIVVLGSILSIDSSCTVAIDNLNEPECSEMMTSTNTDTTVPIIGGIVSGVIVFLIAAAAFVLVIVVFVSKHRKKESYNIQDIYE